MFGEAQLVALQVQFCVVSVPIVGISVWRGCLYQNLCFNCHVSVPIVGISVWRAKASSFIPSPPTVSVPIVGISVWRVTAFSTDNRDTAMFQSRLSGLVFGELTYPGYAVPLTERFSPDCRD